jgi:hypothetical protein
MSRTSITTPKARKVPCCSLELFDWAHDASLKSQPAVRAIIRRAQVSPSMAAVIAELNGYAKEAAHA